MSGITHAKKHHDEHVNGNDDIQDATAVQKGLATAAQITKLDGIDTGADVTGDNPPQGHTLESHTTNLWLLFTKPSRAYDSGGSPKTIQHYDNIGTTYTTNTTVQTAADGDLLQAFLYSGGDPTLTISYALQPSGGIFDVYVNDVLKSSGIDTYNATLAFNTVQINIAGTTAGWCYVKLRTNGKNASSGGYYISIAGISLSS